MARASEASRGGSGGGGAFAQRVEAAKAVPRGGTATSGREPTAEGRRLCFSGGRKKKGGFVIFQNFRGLIEK